MRCSRCHSRKDRSPRAESESVKSFHREMHAGPGVPLYCSSDLTTAREAGECRGPALKRTARSTNFCIAITYSYGVPWYPSTGTRKWLIFSVTLKILSSLALLTDREEYGPGTAGRMARMARMALE